MEGEERMGKEWKKERRQGEEARIEDINGGRVEGRKGKEERRQGKDRTKGGNVRQ